MPARRVTPVCGRCTSREYNTNLLVRGGGFGVRVAFLLEKGCTMFSMSAVEFLFFPRSFKLLEFLVGFFFFIRCPR